MDVYNYCSVPWKDSDTHCNAWRALQTRREMWRKRIIKNCSHQNFLKCIIWSTFSRVASKAQWSNEIVTSKSRIYNLCVYSPVENSIGCICNRDSSTTVSKKSETTSVWANSFLDGHFNGSQTKYKTFEKHAYAIVCRFNQLDTLLLRPQTVQVYSGIMELFYTLETRHLHPGLPRPFPQKYNEILTSLFWLFLLTRCMESEKFSQIS